MFELSRLQLELELLDGHAPPGYWGAKLRGGYGAALKQGLCDHPDLRECSPCPRFRECEYPLLFRPQRSALRTPPAGGPLRNNENLPAPFVIDPPENRDEQSSLGERL